MWRRRSWKFYFGLPPFGFYFHGPRASPSKEEYLGILEEYKKELKEEIREIEKEIKDVRDSQ